jgi:hypothetical protein
LWILSLARVTKQLNNSLMRIHELLCYLVTGRIFLQSISPISYSVYYINHICITSLSIFATCNVLFAYSLQFICVTHLKFLNSLACVCVCVIFCWFCAKALTFLRMRFQTKANSTLHVAKILSDVMHIWFI